MWNWSYLCRAPFTCQYRNLLCSGEFFRVKVREDADRFSACEIPETYYFIYSGIYLKCGYFV